MITTDVHTPMYYYIDDSISSELIFDAIQEFLWLWFWFGFGFRWVIFLFREFVTEIIFLRKELIMHQSLSGAVSKWCRTKVKLTGKNELAKFFEFVRVYWVKCPLAPVINFQNWGNSSILLRAFRRNAHRHSQKAHQNSQKAHQNSQLRLLKLMHGWARTGSVFHRCYILGPILFIEPK